MAQQSNGWSQWEQFEQVPDLQWPQSVRMFTRMEREDSRVSSLLSAIGLPLRRTQWRLDPNGSRPEVLEHVSKNIGLPIDGQASSTMARSRGRFSWPQHLMWALSYLQYGHAVFEQVYRVDDDGMIWLHKLAPRPQRSISQWNVAPDGSLLSVKQWAPAFGEAVASVTSLQGAPSDIGIDRLVVYTRDMEPGFWIGRSLLRPSYKHWLLKDELLRIQATAARRNGMGVPIATGAEGASDDDIKTLSKMAQSYRGGENAGGALPFGATLQLLGVSGNMPDVAAAINYHDQMIAITGLAHFLNLSGGGSYALASVQADTFAQAVQTTGEEIAAIFNAHVIEDLVDVNWGQDEPAPRLVFDAIGSQQDATASALFQLVQAGIITPDQIVETSMRQRMSIPLSPAPESSVQVPEVEPTPEPNPESESVQLSAAAEGANVILLRPVQEALF